ncbi:MAG: YcgN family cysteine cluster protein, partial [Sinobacterium sp.]|nr:YcgN family cysteine cluster protein [Sinobacterium sp.]
MSTSQWESLCDGCSKCCLIKLEDEDSGQVAYTNVVCQYMNEENCQCSEYQTRSELVPNCVWLKPEMVEEFFWLPDSCAYRLISEGKDLPYWHHLKSGSRESIHQA